MVRRQSMSRWRGRLVRRDLSSAPRIASAVLRSSRSISFATMSAMTPRASSLVFDGITARNEIRSATRFTSASIAFRNSGSISICVNFYEQRITRADPADPERKVLFDYPGKRRTAVDIGDNPEGLLDVLERVRRGYTRLPIIITENGSAGFDYIDPTGRIRDSERILFWDGHIRAMREAIARGVDIRGYVAWSLLDAFEWQNSYSRRYGMVFVDYGTQRRIIKDSGRWYQKVIARNGV